MDEKLFFFTALVYVSLINKEAGHLCVCFLAVGVSSLVKCLFVAFVHVSIGLGVLCMFLTQLFVLLPCSPPTATPLGSQRSLSPCPWVLSDSELSLLSNGSCPHHSPRPSVSFGFSHSLSIRAALAGHLACILDSVWLRPAPAPAVPTVGVSATPSASKPPALAEITLQWNPTLRVRAVGQSLDYASISKVWILLFSEYKRVNFRSREGVITLSLSKQFVFSCLPSGLSNETSPFLSSDWVASLFNTSFSSGDRNTYKVSFIKTFKPLVF